MSLLSKLRIALFVLLLFPFSSVRAQGALCQLLQEGKLPLDREVETVRVLDQGCNSNCWLAAYVALAEREHLRLTGEKLPISMEYLMLSDLRVRAFNYIHGTEPDISLGDWSSKGDWLAREYGLLPASIWQPKISASQAPVEAKWVPEIKGLTTQLRRQGLDKNQIWDKIDSHIGGLFGIAPDRFTWQNKSYTRTEFAKSYLGYDDVGKNYFENIIRDGETRGAKCELGCKQNHQEAEAHTKKFLDAGLSAIFLYDFDRSVHLAEKGLLRNSNPSGDKTTERHAILVTGYINDLDGHVLAWKVQNSWGTDSGLAGVYYMSRQFFERYVYMVSLYGYESK